MNPDSTLFCDLGQSISLYLVSRLVIWVIELLLQELNLITHMELNVHHIIKSNHLKNIQKQM